MVRPPGAYLGGVNENFSPAQLSFSLIVRCGLEFNNTESDLPVTLVFRGLQSFSKFVYNNLIINLPL